MQEDDNSTDNSTDDSTDDSTDNSTDNSTDCDSDYEDCEETYYCEPWDEYCLTDCEDDGTCDDFNIDYLSTTGYIVENNWRYYTTFGARNISDPVQNINQTLMNTTNITSNLTGIWIRGLDTQPVIW